MSIEFNKVGYIYSEKTPFEYAALHDVDLKLAEGKGTSKKLAEMEAAQKALEKI